MLRGVHHQRWIRNSRSEYRAHRVGRNRHCKEMQTGIAKAYGIVLVGVWSSIEQLNGLICHRELQQAVIERVTERGNLGQNEFFTL